MAYGRVNIPFGGGEGGERALLTLTFAKEMIGKPWRVSCGERSISGVVPQSGKVKMELAGLGREYRVQAGDTEAWGEAAVKTEEGTTEYTVTVEAHQAKGGVRYIQIGTTQFNEPARDREGKPLAIPAYGGEARRALERILGAEDGEEPQGGRRSERESAVMACLAEKDGEEPPKVTVYRGYVTREQVEQGTAEVKVTAATNSQVQVMAGGATSVNVAAAADKEAGADNVQSAKYSRGHTDVLTLTVMLDRLKGEHTPPPEMRYGYDEWMGSWPVVHIWFKVTNGAEVWRYMLELRVMGTGESGRQRAIRYVDDGEQEGYALWVFGARADHGTYDSIRTGRHMAAAEYKKDANGQEVYATDDQGGYLETVALADGSYAYADTAHSRNIRVIREEGRYRYVDAATGKELSNPAVALLLDERGAPVRIPADIETDGVMGKGYHTTEDGAALLDLGGRYIPKRFHAKVFSRDQDEGLGFRWDMETEQLGAAWSAENVFRGEALAQGETRRLTLKVYTAEDEKRKNEGKDMVYGPLEYEIDIEREDNGAISEDYPFFSYLYGLPTGTSGDVWRFFPREEDGVFRQVALTPGLSTPMTFRAHIGEGCTVRFSYVDDSGQTVEQEGNASNSVYISAVKGPFELTAKVQEGTEEREYRIEVKTVPLPEETVEPVLPRI